MRTAAALLAFLLLSACSRSTAPWRCAADEECADSDPCSTDRCEASTGTCRHYLGCVESVSAGDEHTCVLTFAGGLKCWGYNDLGQLGIGYESVGIPYPADVVGSASGLRAVSAGGWNTCSINGNGGVKCWGTNLSGALGIGVGQSDVPESPVPLDVLGLSSGVSDISQGGAGACAVMEVSGGVKCWGDNENGMLGVGSERHVYAPADVIGLESDGVAVSTGAFHQCALTATSGVKCWGANWLGQVGVGSINNEVCFYSSALAYCTSPVDVVGLESGVAAVSAGTDHSCALMLSGAVKCWGWNEFGQLGDGTSENRYTPVEVSGLSGVVAISTCAVTTYALMPSGEIKSWGYNSHGELGDGSSVYSSPVPVEVSGLPGTATAVAAGGDFACALLVSGELACWGSNFYGQLGDGTKTDKPFPTMVLAY